MVVPFDDCSFYHRQSFSQGRREVVHDSLGRETSGEGCPEVHMQGHICFSREPRMNDPIYARMLSSYTTESVPARAFRESLGYRLLHRDFRKG